MTAFGSTGPYADRPGFDPLLQAMSGMMALQGFGGPPQYLRIAVTDYYTASLAAQAMLTGLFVRERTGRGQRVETSLLHGSLSFQSGNTVEYAGKPTGFRPSPAYRLYQAGDDEWFFLACGNQPIWVRLCTALGLDELAHDPRFASWLLRNDNAAALMPLLEERFRTKPREPLARAPRASTTCPRRPCRRSPTSWRTIPPCAITTSCASTTIPSSASSACSASRSCSPTRRPTIPAARRRSASTRDDDPARARLRRRRHRRPLRAAGES